MKIANHTERIAHFGIAITLGLLTLSACASAEREDVTLNDCIATSTGMYVTEHGDVTKEIFALIESECAERVNP